MVAPTSATTATTQNMPSTRQQRVVNDGGRQTGDDRLPAVARMQGDHAGTRPELRSQLRRSRCDRRC